MKFSLKKPLPPKPKSNNKTARVTRYRTASWPGHPLAQADGKVYVHRATLYEKIGPNHAPCNWCGRLLGWWRTGKFRLLSDHVDGDKRNNDPANLVPSCFDCNLFRSIRGSAYCRNGHYRSPVNTRVRAGSKYLTCLICEDAREVARRPRRPK